MTTQEKVQLTYEANKAFTPSAPIDDFGLFAGRQNEISSVIGAVAQKGRHVVIFGERGVGKTSLTNVLDHFLNLISSEQEFVVRINADTNSTTASLWRNVFRRVPAERVKPRVGFGDETETEQENLESSITDDASPEDIRHLLEFLNAKLVVIFDEVDRIKIKKTIAAISDTIKTFSDHAVPVTMILVGVADSVEELVQNHPSIERAIVQVKLPRMPTEETKEIVNNGLAKFNMAIDVEALNRIAHLSQGLPHYTHLLALLSTKEAIQKGEKKITLVHVRTATAQAVEQAQQSIKAAYHSAISSARGNLYPQVLLACALSPVDDLGYFNTVSAREPMARIMKRPYEISAYSRHLNDFCQKERGTVLQRAGHRRRYRYRFTNPVMQPFIIMKGLSEGLIQEELWDFS